MRIPNSPELEQSVLGACLHRGRAPGISPDCFYRDAHRKIAVALLKMASEGRVIDLVTVWEYLSAQNEIESIGGASYLAALLEGVSNPENQEHYEKIVRQIFRDRTVKLRCMDFACKTEVATPDELRAMTTDLGNAITETAMDATPIMTVMKKVLTEIEDRVSRGGGLLGLSTGLADLDEITSGLCPSDLVVIAGRPGMGKTSLATHIAAIQAKEGRTVLFFSVEMPNEQIAYRLLSQRTRIDLKSMRAGKLSEMDCSRVVQSMEHLSRLPLPLHDDPIITDTEICRRSRKLNPDLIIVDHLGKVTSSLKNDRYDLQLGEITRNLKALAKSLNVPVVLLCQLNRKVEDRPKNRPQLSDLRDSGSIEQDADVVMFLYRDEVYSQGTPDKPNPNAGICEIVVAKQRNGPTGVIPVMYLEYCTAFGDLSREDVAAFWRRKK